MTDSVVRGLERLRRELGEATDETAPWAALQSYLAGGDQSHEAGLVFGVNAAARYPLDGASARLPEVVRVTAGPAWLALHAAESPEAGAIALSMTLHTVLYWRTQRLMDERSRLAAYTVKTFAHTTRNDVAALASLGEMAALRVGDISDPAQLNKAITDSASHVYRLLVLHSLLIDDEPSADDRARFVDVLGDEGEIPGDAAAGVSLPGLRNIVRVIRAAMGDDGATAASWDVRLHEDGWAVALTAGLPAGAHHHGSWLDLHDLPLAFAALAVNAAGGRTWAVTAGDTVHQLGLTIEPG